MSRAAPTSPSGYRAVKRNEHLVMHAHEVRGEVPHEVRPDEVDVVLVPHNLRPRRVRRLQKLSPQAGATQHFSASGIWRR